MSVKRQRSWQDPWEAQYALGPPCPDRTRRTRDFYSDHKEESECPIAAAAKKRKTESLDVKFAVCREPGRKGVEYSVKVEKGNRISVEAETYDYVNTFHFGTILTQNRESARLLHLNMIDGEDGLEYIRFIYTFAGNTDLTQSIVLGPKQLRKCMRKNLKKFVPKKADGGGVDRGAGLTSRCTAC